MRARAADVEKTTGTHVFLVLWKAYRALRAKADASRRRLKLGDSDFRVLEALLHKGPLPVNAIGKKVDLTTGSITTAIDRLEQKSLVVRKNHPGDRRIRVVELTAKGRRLIEKGYEKHKLHMEKFVGCLTLEERSQLVDLLKRLGTANAEVGKSRLRPNGR
jgi:MarR family transcriptional regulator, 2-MHQ and catechol-resistance regulon repressor